MLATTIATVVTARATDGPTMTDAPVFWTGALTAPTSPATRAVWLARVLFVSDAEVAFASLVKLPAEPLKDVALSEDTRESERRQSMGQERWITGKELTVAKE
jgi:hypothetical protein